MDPLLHGFDAFLADLAGRQRGVVTRTQLLAAGFSPTVIRRRVRSGGLIPVHPGVYLVGHRAVHPLAYETAAIPACRPRALLSHHTAARLRRIPVPDDASIHITVVNRTRRSLRGVTVHSITHLALGELARHDGLPITSPSLTLLDLAGVLTEAQLVTALNEARVQRLKAADLRATLRAHPTRPGAGALGRLLRSEQAPRITRSPAERRALNLMRECGVEPDETDYAIGPYRLDFYFRRERLAVEVDGYRFHGTRGRFTRDRRRTAYLAARNIQVFPLTWDDLGGRAARAMSELRETLERRRTLFAAQRR